ncbi:MAG: glycosyltransferase, partial [Acidimicrobiia bacterium]|nr:glycosyltransferase [Acidimicrobiia bacterium]
MNILMISKSEYTSDVRVRREAEALTNAGHSVTVIDASSKDEVSNRVTILGSGAIPGLGMRRPKQSSVLYRIARWALLPEHRQRAIAQFQHRASSRAEGLAEPPDVIHAHDFPALEPAATLRERFGSKLIYDAHEYW